MTKPIKRDPIYRRRRYRVEIIELCVRWYITYRLSYRDLVAMMAERGVAVSGPVREEPSDATAHIHTYSDNIVQFVGELKRGSHFNMRFTAYTRADDNAGIALQPYLPGVMLAADTPAPADASLCRNGETG